MSTRVTHDITERTEVRYCLHGEGEFQINGQLAQPDHSMFFANLTPEQATQLRHHLTVWLEAGPVTQFGMGGPIVRGDDIQEKLRTMEVGGPSQGIDADRKAWVESLNAWAPRTDGEGSFFGCTPSNPVHYERNADHLPARVAIRRFMAEFRSITGEQADMRVTVTRGRPWPAFEIETEDGKCVVECKRHG